MSVNMDMMIMCRFVGKSLSELSATTKSMPLSQLNWIDNVPRAQSESSAVVKSFRFP